MNRKTVAPLAAALVTAATLAAACSSPPSEDSEATTTTESAATSCAHTTCTVGRRLSSSCNACAATVCAGDSYCCATSWDAQCVREAKSGCADPCGTPAPPPTGTGTGTPPPPPPGGLGTDGGTVTNLFFGIVGDTRPSFIDDTAGYPSDVITTLFGEIQALADRPPFVVSTGDYQFSSPTNGDSALQMDLYLKARNKYSGLWFPTMGNHECTGFTNSNCGAGTKNGVTEIYANYLSKLLGPINKTLPYYVLHVNAKDGSWTSKFVFVAANAWTSTQQQWLTTTLAEPTTYTFIVRHEAANVTSAPGVTPSERIMAQYPYTLSIVGHDHTYSRAGRELLVGNGGAPLGAAVSFGYALVKRRSDGAVAVDMYDYQSNAADAGFHFAVNADGSDAAP